MLSKCLVAPCRMALRTDLRPDTLVLSGGGVKGVGTLGAVRTLHRSGVLSGIKTVVGTSAGALVGAVAATSADFDGALQVICDHGYTPDFDFNRFFKVFGLDSGQCIDSLASRLLEDPDVTFSQVLARHGKRFIVCVTNLCTRSAEYLGPDTHPDMPVTLALRMSCSVPLLFGAVPHKGAWYADGSITDNFPCNWAADNGARRVLGVCSRPITMPIRSFEAFVAAVVESASRSQYCGRAEVLDLDMSGVKTLDFGAPREDLVRMFNSGARQAEAFMKEPDSDSDFEPEPEPEPESA